MQAAQTINPTWLPSYMGGSEEPGSNEGPPSNCLPEHQVLTRDGKQDQGQHNEPKHQFGPQEHA
jgi:hypothetical protein